MSTDLREAIRETDRHSAGTLAIVCSHLQIALDRTQDRITRDYIESSMRLLEGTQEALLSGVKLSERLCAVMRIA